MCGMCLQKGSSPNTITPFRQACHRSGIDGHFPLPDPFTDNPEPQNDREERKGSEGKEKQRLFCMLLRWARWVVCLFIQSVEVMGTEHRPLPIFSTLRKYSCGQLESREQSQTDSGPTDTRLGSHETFPNQKAQQKLLQLSRLL